MGKMDALLLRSKFRGSMLGALMGDCLGSAYEGEEIFTAGMKLVIQRSFDKLEGPHFKAPVIQFTDDSAMTFAVAESLIEHGGFDQKDMAKKFVKSFYKEPNRGYGAGVTTVFQKLRNNKFVDILGPAREQFNGEGSLGNGGAMRVAPVALFCHKNYELMVDVARKQSQITHTHKTGVDGAILQAIAIRQSLLLDPKEKLDTCKFTDDLIEKMDKIEVDEEGLGLVNPSPYKTQLKLVRDLISEEGDGPHDEKVVHHLGTDISALHSVPTAIYCFLRAQKPIKHVETENPLRRTIQYANIYCSAAQVRNSGCKSALKRMMKENARLLDAGDPRLGEYRSNYEELRIEKSLSLVLKEQFSPLDMFSQRNSQNPHWSCIDDSNSFYEHTTTPSLDKSTRLSRRVKYRPPSSLRIRIPRNMHSLQLSDYRSINAGANSQRPEVQLILSSDSLLSETSSSTIVCAKRSDFTSTPVKSFAECGVQWGGLDSKNQSSTFSCNDSSVGKETRDSAILVEFDEHDAFAQTIASYLRAMDVETAFKAQNQIQKVINDHRLRKPETQSIRLLRPEISEKGTKQRGPRGIEKSHHIAPATRPIKRKFNYLRRSSREIQHTARSNKDSSPNKTVLSKPQQFRAKVRKHSPVVEPIITHYKRRDSTSTSVKSNAIDKSICLGGDTDTIGSMAGAIAGAFYGEELVKQEVLNHCESSSEFRNLADQLFELTST